jgi:DNA polymerase III psi subunit
MNTEVSNEALNDEEVALMCDILQSMELHLNSRKELELSRLTALGYLKSEPEAPGGRGYRITAKGQQYLDERGVGANES